MTASDPLWFKNAVIYQVHARTFVDSNGDGIGDFTGLASRLDHIQSLGVNAIWVMPFYPSPLRDEGYDIADYMDVNPMYGSLDDVRTLIDEAHRRGLRIITELVINHTSDQHPWFQRARRAPIGSAERDFYVWSDTTEKYTDARIIFLDTEPSNWTWDDVAGQYFWHRFYHHQPDLNFDNPAVQAAVFDVLDFWLDMGVDGFRLDAIPYLYEREGTTGENLPETHAFLKQLRARIDARRPDVMLLAEANQWPEDTRPYFGDGDECHMNYNFPVMPRLYMAVAKEDRSSIIDILEQTPPIPDSCQWAMFLRNHDELTLEMVTEEERDYMWRTYAPDPRARLNLGIRRRLAPLMGGDRRRIELLNSLLFSMPGTPVIYYGDEIGMGDNIWLNDRDGVRTPMQWSAGQNAGFSTADPAQLYLPVITDPQFQPAVVNVELQETNPNSQLNWMRRIIPLRQAHPVFGAGDIAFLQPENQAVLAFVRADNDESILVVANLSGRAQAVELELGAYQGIRPVDLFGQASFPQVDDSPYAITLAPYGFYWLQLRAVEPEISAAAPLVDVTSEWRPALDDTRQRRAIEAALAQALPTHRWYSGKARSIRSLRVVDLIDIPVVDDLMTLALADVEYADGAPETYVLPLRGSHADDTAALVTLRHSDGSLTSLADACHDEASMTALLDLVGTATTVVGAHGAVTGAPTDEFAALRGTDALTTRLSGVEQSNTSVMFGDRLVMKVLRRAAEGLNPEWELGRYLTERAELDCIAPTAGALEYLGSDGRERTLALVQAFVPNAGDAWAHALTLLDDLLTGSTVDLEPSLTMARALGVRTAQMHLALAAASEPALAPKAFTPHYQRSVYQSTRQQVRQALDALARLRPSLTGETAVDADALLALGPAINDALAPVKDERIHALRIRTHGDYHLGQVLFTGDDYVIIDFEGEPAKPLSERRIPTSPLRDVAGMLRSFDYAGRMAARARGSSDDVVARAQEWTTTVSRAFLAEYHAQADGHVLPEGKHASDILLRTFLIEKAAYEVIYELNNRPEWVGTPLRGLLTQVRGT